MDNLPQIVLTPTEANVIKILRYAEGLAEMPHDKPRRLGGSLAMPDAAVLALRMHRMSMPYRVNRIEGTDMHQVYFTIDQLLRYAEFVCMRAGITVGLDGTATTRSGLSFAPEQLPA